jgi:hypothetical protein
VLSGALLVCAALGCSGGSQAARARAVADSARLAAADTPTIVATDAPDTGADTAGQSVTATVHVEDTSRVRAVGMEQFGRLSPLADSIANQMTFLATFQTVFVAASRARRVLLDIGRVDAKLNGHARHAAYLEAATQLSPVRVGDRFRLHGPWGGDDAVVTGFDQWHGRIVATLAVPPNVDSLARGKATLVAIAERADSAMPPVIDSCAHRDSADTATLARATVVRDSLMLMLQGDTARLPPGVLKGRRLAASLVYGCFGSAHVLLFVNAGAEANMYTREFTVLVDTTGRVIPLRVNDVRFRIHQALQAGALDVDGDGVDDVAAIGRSELTGGTVVLRLDLAKRRLTYVMSGFAWESF